MRLLVPLVPLLGFLCLASCNRPNSPERIRPDTTDQAEVEERNHQLNDQDRNTSGTPPPPPASLADVTEPSDALNAPEPPGTDSTSSPAEHDADSLSTNTDDPENVAGSCDVRSTEQFCFTYTGENWSPTSAEEHCNRAPDSEFRTQGCPIEQRIATCIFHRDDNPEEEIAYTYYEPFDPVMAEVACPGEFRLEE